MVSISSIALFLVVVAVSDDGVGFHYFLLRAVICGVLVEGYHNAAG